MKYLIVFLIMINNVFAITDSEFVALAKKTNSVYSGNADIDINNAGKVHFETLVQDQLVYLYIGTSNLNSSMYTIVNNETGVLKNRKSLPAPPVVTIGDFDLDIDGLTTAECDGSDVIATDTDCTGKKCTIKQLVVSMCNQTDDCWEANPTTDRNLVDAISENFSLTTKVDISKCLPNSIPGAKHALNMSVGTAGSGGSINYSLILQNDSYNVMFSNYRKN